MLPGDALASAGSTREILAVIPAEDDHDQIGLAKFDLALGLVDPIIEIGAGQPGRALALAVADHVGVSVELLLEQRADPGGHEAVAQHQHLVGLLGEGRRNIGLGTDVHDHLDLGGLGRRVERTGIACGIGRRRRRRRSRIVLRELRGRSGTLLGGAGRGGVRGCLWFARAKAQHQAPEGAHDPPTPRMSVHEPRL